MRKQSLKKAAALAISVMCMAGVFTGCGNNNSNTSSGDNANTDAKLTGSITAAGSSALKPLVDDAADLFNEKHPDVNITIDAGGSGEGLKQVAEGTVNIGNSDVEAAEKLDASKASQLVDHKVCVVTMAPIVNKDVTAGGVKNLTKQQLTDIYTGKITNWKDLGGSDEAIVVIGREAASGTRGAFEELLEVKNKCAYAQELDSTGAVLAKVAATPGAIGYVSLDVVDKTVAALKLDGVDATEDNIKAGKYTLSRPFVMATKGSVSSQSELVQTWFNFVKSDAGKKVIKGVGLILPE